LRKLSETKERGRSRPSRDIDICDAAAIAAREQVRNELAGRIKRRSGLQKTEADR
jgi:hypothetical protein